MSALYRQDAYIRYTDSMNRIATTKEYRMMPAAIANVGGSHQRQNVPMEPEDYCL